MKLEIGKAPSESNKQLVEEPTIRIRTKQAPVPQETDFWKINSMANNPKSEFATWKITLIKM